METILPRRQFVIVFIVNNDGNSPAHLNDFFF